MANILEEVEGKVEQGSSALNEYIDKRVDQEVQARMRSAVPWVLGIGAGILLAYMMTRPSDPSSP